MNVEIEVVAAEAVMLMHRPTVRVHKTAAEVVMPAGRVATSILRYLRQGRSSLSAVSPDFNFKGGTAVA